MGIREEETNSIHPINVQNKKKAVVSNLPENSVLETSGYFKDSHMIPIRMGRIPSEILHLVQVHAENTQKFVDAAVSGDPDKLLIALLADPACQFIEVNEMIEDMMWNKLHYEQKWLPNFEESKLPKDELKNRKHYESKKDLKKNKEARRVKWIPNFELKSKADLPQINN